ncbi:MAG: ABC transporter substrate-binding protein [Aliarcobacter sp.]|nr:ABC transporter substrate-binding protein [Aliarcobacter sp.]
MWLDQFEFAGFYVAKEKGFYKDVGLDVELKKYDSSLNLLEEVLNKNADFGTSSSSLITDKSNGKDIVLLGSIFQSSPLILLALKNSNINYIEDIKNKTLMITKEQQKYATFKSMVTSKGVTLNDIKIIDHSFDVSDLINKKTDLMLAYTTNEPFLLKEKGYESKIFNPKDYGFDFYEEIIFTSKEFASKNPKLVKDFYSATIKGWEYAFENIEEVAKLIYEKYNPQNKTLASLIFEANEMKKLVYDKNGKIGTITPERINLIINTYRVMGLIEHNINVDDLIYTQHLDNTIYLSNEEKNYLNKKEKITMCVDPNWMPFEKIENGKHIGIAADYIKLLEEKIKKPITLVPTKTWSESLEFGQKRTCDIFSLVMTTPQREKYLNFTKPYLEIPLVIAANINTPFIDNFQQVEDKKLGIVKGYSFGEILKMKYPKTTFVEVENINDGLELVRKGQIFGFIDTLVTVGYHIQNNYIGQLKISGKFDEIWKLGIGARNDEPILTTIFEKAINDITANQKQQILNKWVSVNYQKEIDYAFIYKILTASIILTFIIFIFYRQYLLKKLNAQLNEKIELEIQKNEEKNKILIQQSRMASMGEMLENIAHQWRQPLSTISVAASGMEIKKEFSTLSDEEFYEAINHIKKSTLYLSNTIDDFRSFFSKNKTPAQLSTNHAIEKVIELMGNTFMQHRINLIKNVEDIKILSLENELIQVLMNILVNAKDALKQTLGDEKYIIIDVYKKENNLIIDIKDSAGGIDEEIIDKIFEPYFTTKHKFNGTGIGLYMSKLLVEKHLRGTIKAVNTEFTFMDKIHKGALFEIVLPISS